MTKLWYKTVKSPSSLSPKWRDRIPRVRGRGNMDPCVPQVQAVVTCLVDHRFQESRCTQAIAAYWSCRERMKGLRPRPWGYNLKKAFGKQ